MSVSSHFGRLSLSLSEWSLGAPATAPAGLFRSLPWHFTCRPWRERGSLFSVDVSCEGDKSRRRSHALSFGSVWEEARAHQRQRRPGSSPGGPASSCFLWVWTKPRLQLGLDSAPFSRPLAPLPWLLAHHPAGLQLLLPAVPPGSQPPWDPATLFLSRWKHGERGIHREETGGSPNQGQGAPSRPLGACKEDPTHPALGKS